MWIRVSLACQFQVNLNILMRVDTRKTVERRICRFRVRTAKHKLLHRWDSPFTSPLANERSEKTASLNDQSSASFGTMASYSARKMASDRRLAAETCTDGGRGRLASCSTSFAMATSSVHHGSNGRAPKRPRTDQDNAQRVSNASPKCARRALLDTAAAEKAPISCEKDGAGMVPHPPLAGPPCNVRFHLDVISLLNRSNLELKPASAMRSNLINKN